MTIIYKLNLTAQEASVVYTALTKVGWSGIDAEAELSVRTSIERIGVKKTGASLHDLLTETGAIDGREKPDTRTEKEKAAGVEAEEAKIAKANEKREANRERYQIRKICKAYDMSYEDDHEYYHDNGVPVRSSKWWVSPPTWLEGDDPLEDGHFAHRLDEVLWLLEFYAKHHPDHPDYAKREYFANSPHC